jgi:hypothetical protein
MSKLTELITTERKDARDFESGISWLFWMLGFSPANIGGTKLTENAADLVLASPGGNIVVIECTTGLLRAENKLANLYERTQKARRSIQALGGSETRVLAIIVTLKFKSDVTAELEQAERHGILVLAREDIESAMRQTRELPNADRFYAEAEDTVETARAQYDETGG